MSAPTNLIHWQGLLAVALGGAGGAVLRHLLSHGTHVLFPSLLPAGTLLVNAVGSFLLAYLAQAILYAHPPAHPLRLLLTIGFCGSLTTFSTYSLETFGLLREGQIVEAFAYASGSVLLCLLAAWCGFWVGSLR